MDVTEEQQQSMKLEDLRANATVRGVLADSLVTVVSVQWFGSEALELTYKTPAGKVANELLYRDDEVRLEIVEVGRPWSFDGDGALFRLVSEALRIRLAHLFDPVLAVHTSVVEPLPHQITAVYESMLPRQPLRFLLADDPGAGKTIMAGLLIKELIARGDLQRCLVVCPGSLAEQWQDELYRRFHLPFDILTNDKLEAARTGNWFLETNLAIARLDKFSRNEDIQQKLQVPDCRWDLVVCDEAHKMSATFFGGEVKYTKRYRLGQLLSGLTRHFLLMSATPHNGKETASSWRSWSRRGNRSEGKCSTCSASSTSKGGRCGNSWSRRSATASNRRSGPALIPRSTTPSTVAGSRTCWKSVPLRTTPWTRAACSASARTWCGRKRADYSHTTSSHSSAKRFSASFREAFQRLGGAAKQREARRYEITHVPAPVRNRDRLIGIGEPVLPRYERIAFEKSLVAPPGQPLAAFVCPGHPLLDAVIDLTLERHRDLLKRGAVLIDERDGGDRPRVLFYLEHAIQDASLTRSGERRVVSKRMLYVELDADGVTRHVHYAPYLDYRPLGEDDPDVASILDRPECAWIDRDMEKQAQSYAVARVVPEHLAEVRDARLALIAKTEAAVKDRLTKEITYWDHRAEQLKAQEQAGKTGARLNSGEARKRADNLQARLQKRLEELRLEAQISPLPPVVLGGLLVVQKGLLDVIAGREADYTRTAADTQASAARARGIIMEVERGLGYEPVDRELEKLGYDIESRMPDTGRLRFIEVKGRVSGAATGDRDAQRDPVLAEQARGLHPGHRGVPGRRRAPGPLCSRALSARAGLRGDKRQLRLRGAAGASGTAVMTAGYTRASGVHPGLRVEASLSETGECGAATRVAPDAA